MKNMKILTPTLTLGVVALGAVQAQAQFVVSYFNFNGLGATVDVTTILPTSGNGSLSTTFTPNGSTGVTSFGGSTVNQQASDSTGAGTALALVNQTNNGKFLTLQVNTTGYFGLTYSFATQRTGTGFGPAATPNQLSYSLDGTTYTPFATYTPAAAFALQTFDLSSIPALDDQSNVYLRLTFNGASSASGNNRIDNLKVTAANTPAPSSLLVALIGVPGIALMVRRRKAAK